MYTQKYLYYCESRNRFFGDSKQTSVPPSGSPRGRVGMPVSQSVLLSSAIDEVHGFCIIAEHKLQHADQVYSLFLILNTFKILFLGLSPFISSVIFLQITFFAECITYWPFSKTSLIYNHLTRVFPELFFLN